MIHGACRRRGAMSATLAVLAFTASLASAGGDVTSACPPECLPSNLPDRAIHQVRRAPQESSFWCWAAVTQMIGEAFNKPVGTQCAIAERTKWPAGFRDFCRENMCPCSSATAAACTRSACGDRIATVLNVCGQVGFPRLDAACLTSTIIPDQCLDGTDSTPSWDRLRFELGRRGPTDTSKGQPIILWIKPVGGGFDHVVACKGFHHRSQGANAVKLLFVVDPFPPCIEGAQGEITSVTYPAMADQLGDEWIFVRAYVDIRDGACTPADGSEPTPTVTGGAGGRAAAAPAPYRAPKASEDEILDAATRLLPYMCEIAGSKDCKPRLGAPIPRRYVRVDALAVFKATDDPSSITEDGGWLVPVFDRRGVSGSKRGGTIPSGATILGGIVVKRTTCGKIEPLMTMGDAWTQRVVEAVTLASPSDGTAPAPLLLVIPGFGQQHVALRATDAAPLTLRRIDLAKGSPTVGIERPASDVFAGIPKTAPAAVVPP